MTPDAEAQGIALGARGMARVVLGPVSAGHLSVRLEGRHIEASDVVPLEPSLPAFFRELDRMWRGWDGEQRWTSAGDGCTIRARHDGLGHISLIVSLREPGQDREPVSETWEASLGIWLEPADLPAIADGLDRYLAHDGVA